ncbi:MAG TPA: PAS domain S-box protein [Pirellulales bacterium]|jgi:PAS domain S-box-containing protein
MISPLLPSLIGLSCVAALGCAFGFGKRRRNAQVSDPKAATADEAPAKSRDRVDSGEWQRVKDALRISEEKYRVLIENANDAICVAQDGVVKFFNPKLQQMLGYTSEHLSTMPFTDVIADEDRPLVLDRYMRRLRGEDIPHQYEFRLLTSSGRRLWIEINSVMIDWEGRPATLSFFRDVDEQKKTEQALRDSEALYHSLVESLPLSIFRKDAEGRIIFANRRFCEILGRPLEALQNKTDADLFPGEMAEKYRSDDQQVLSTGRVLEVVEEHQRADGEVIHVQVLKAPVLGADGQVRGVQGMFWDVSARRRVEEKLRENAERTRLILDTAYDAFVGVDEEGRIIDWNPQAETVFGWPRDEALGRRVAETIIPQRFREVYRHRLQQTLARGQGAVLNKRIEITAMRRDGSEFPVEAAITPVQLGKTRLYHAFLHDISRRKRYESELRVAKEAAEAANRAKGAFLANMSHEIRTPMNAIIGMAELILDTSLSAEQREYLKLVLESADSLLSIINDLLDFSKIEAGKFDLDPIPFEIHESIGDTMKSLAVRAHKKGLELVHDISPDVPKAVVGDSNRLRQVVINLVGNAIKFTDQGEVVMSVRRHASDPDGMTLHFAVQDTGIGIPADKQGIIFRAFEQADTSTTRRFGGTGLGLAISSALVDLMGGRVWVESKEGVGSTFHFTARFQDAVDLPLAEPSATADALEGLRVLVVDDNATNRRIQCEMLHNWRMQPVPAAGANEALQALRDAHRTGRPFTLVLTDANMPEVDGFSLAGAIKADVALSSAVIMMLTSGDRPDDVARCHQLGITSYLMKPVKQSELFDAIAAALAPADVTAADQPPEARQVDARRLSILLAEDSLVNQKLAVGLLQRRGHRVHVTNNGREALAALDAQPFDVVLMDVQMPEMDGLDATRALREREVVTGRTRVPVIAMTAHAMAGDRERCLASGMDSYISKPIRSRDLFATIVQLTDGEEAPSNMAAPEKAIADAGLDWNAMMETVGGDRDLLREIAAAFLEEAPHQLRELRDAAATGDAETLCRTAHTLKASLRYLGAASLAEDAFTLESCGRDQRIADAAIAMPLFIERVQDVLKQLPPLVGLQENGTD